MKRMQSIQPQMQALQKQYKNDKEKLMQEQMRLYKEYGVNPVAGCLPMIVQIPVFIGLFHVLREFGPTNGDGSPRTENYFFGQDGVDSFNNASLFGAKLGNWVSANNKLDTANVANPIDKLSVQILQDKGTVFRFDGSDLMPGAVGAGTFWKGMIEWINGKDTATVLSTIESSWPK